LISDRDIKELVECVLYLIRNLADTELLWAIVKNETMRFYITIFIWIILTSCDSKQHADKIIYKSDTLLKVEKRTVDSFPNDTLTKLVDDLSQFIPKGFHLIKAYSSDLNIDSLEDKIILCGEDSMERKIDTITDGDYHSIIRPLILLIRQKDKTLKEFSKNNERIFYDPSNFSSGDAFDDIIFEKGQFSISYFYHMGYNLISKQYIFKYSKREKDWFLFNIVLYSEYNYGEQEKIKTNYDITYNEKDFGKIKFCDFNRDIRYKFDK